MEYLRGQEATIEGNFQQRITSENLFFNLVDEGPVFVIDERVYYCDSKGKNRFNDGARTRGVKDGPLLLVLERSSELSLKPDYERFQEDFLRRELSSWNIQDNVSRSHGRLVRFVVKEMFPFLRRENDSALDDLFGTAEEPGSDREKRTGELRSRDNELDREIEQYINNRARELERTRTKRNPVRRNKLEEVLFGQEVSRSSSNDSALSRSIGGLDFAVIGDNVFSLALVQRNADLVIGRQGYALLPLSYLADLKQDYSDAVVRGLSLKALREGLRDSREFRELKAKRDDIDLLCRRDEYHEKDFGFRKRDGKIVVYVDVPEYVLRSPHNRSYYRFDAHKLGIELSLDYDNVILPNGPFSLGYEEGPFYSSSGSLCMGNYSCSYLERGGAGEKGRAFAKLLIDARNVVLRGYRSSHVHPHHRLDQEDYSARRISKEEIKNRGLSITNINYQSRGF